MKIILTSLMFILTLSSLNAAERTAACTCKVYNRKFVSVTSYDHGERACRNHGLCQMSTTYGAGYEMVVWALSFKTNRKNYKKNGIKACKKYAADKLLDAKWNVRKVKINNCEFID